MTVKDEIEQLRAELDEHNYRYYVLSLSVALSVRNFPFFFGCNVLYVYSLGNCGKPQSGRDPVCHFIRRSYYQKLLRLKLVDSPSYGFGVIVVCKKSSLYGSDHGFLSLGGNARLNTVAVYEKTVVYDAFYSLFAAKADRLKRLARAAFAR